jgi:hypothetical protein
MCRKHWLIFPVLMIALFACVKDPPGTPPTKLRINLQGTALSGDDVDSADLVLRGQGGVVKTIKLSLLTTASMEFWWRNLPAGMYTADIEVYTKAGNSKSLQYVLIKPVILSGMDTTIVWTGPAAQSGTGWAKRHVQATANNDIVVIIPDDVYDPYFEIRVKRPYWNNFQIERLALAGSAVVAFKTWKCQSQCFTNGYRITNKDFFLPFTQTIQGSNWTENNISISVGSHPDQQYVDFEKTWHQ